MPSRRRVLRGGGAVLAALGGCVAARDAPDRPAADATGATTTPPAETTETPEPTTTAAETTTTTAEPTTDRYQTETAPRNRVIIEATGELTLTVTKYRTGDAEREVASETYDLSDGSEVHVTSFDPEGYLAFALDGEVVWRGEIGVDGSYRFTVSPDGDVDLTYSIR